MSACWVLSQPPSCRSIKDLTWGGIFFAVGVFLATFTGSALVVGFLFVKLPATYFQRSHPRELLPESHLILRMAAHIAKNVLGFILVMVGIMLSLPGVPGQGILTILIGIMLLDFPGKRELERRIVSCPGLFQAINALRRRFGKPPLVLDSEPKARVGQ
jgi:hypothetical protein